MKTGTRINKEEIAEMFNLDVKQVGNIASNNDNFPKCQKIPGERMYFYDRDEIITFFLYYQNRPSQRKIKIVTKEEINLPLLFHSIFNQNIKNSMEMT
ncbi:hypothetical protein UFOVP1367_32 [uncultured Caudovirales phage]|uniref:Uncharacterized protein n=1 Tax=uncultured Caudovirales phage TaxID=2100421 RepID=A0A6J5RW81_9CAUD|nr:hypothetical protein KNT69_gp32 [uncultured Caudovirales phage]CAB4202694.1 hypothetical protein UFOVP1367_32 [uncultured Caudovirales phage]